jgi:hypothetical protein
MAVGGSDRSERVHNAGMSRPEKALYAAVAAFAGAAVGYLYLVHILRPAPAGIACPPGSPHDLCCVSYQIAGWTVRRQASRLAAG